MGTECKGIAYKDDGNFVLSAFCDADLGPERSSKNVLLVLWLRAPVRCYDGDKKGVNFGVEHKELEFDSFCNVSLGCFMNIEV